MSNEQPGTRMHRRPACCCCFSRPTKSPALLAALIFLALNSRLENDNVGEVRGRTNANICCVEVVEGAPLPNSYQRGRNRRHDQRRQRRRRPHYGGGGGARRPRSMFSGAGGADGLGSMYGYYDEEEDDASSSSLSYFERHNLIPPPLISRQRRRTQTKETNKEEEDSKNSKNEMKLSYEEQQKLLLEFKLQNSIYEEDDNFQLRYDLLYGYNRFDRYYYDKHAYPWEYVWYNQTATTANPDTAKSNNSNNNNDKELAGLPIEQNINFHRVFDVDIVNAIMDLVVWFRLTWVDPRLTWNPSEYSNIRQTWFWIGDGGAGGETSEIWTPDVELWNLETGLRHSLEDAYVTVNYDGTVTWSRPGHLKPTCKFTGLDYFPFDRLTCAMEFGSWMHSGRYLQMVKQNSKGYSMGGSVTSGESYEEYSFAKEDPIVCESVVYTTHEENFPHSEEGLDWPGELIMSAPWPVLIYNVTVTRSWEPYARGYITTQVILNIVGFSAFWLPPYCGERMTLTVVAIMAALTSDIVIAAHIPAAAEITWYSKFSFLSTAFAFLSLIESVLVLYFYHKRNEDLVPHWYTYMKNWHLARKAKKSGEVINERSSEVAEKSCEEIKKHGMGAVSQTTEFATESTTSAVDALSNTTDAAVHCVKELGREEFATKSPSPSSNSLVGDSSSSDDTHESIDTFRRQGRSDTCGRLGQRTTVFEEEVAELPDRSTMLQDFKDRFGEATRRFLATPKNADDFNNLEEFENNLHWKHVATKIDDVARFWIPLTFVVALSILLSEVF